MFWRKPKGEGAANRLSDEAEPNMLSWDADGGLEAELDKGDEVDDELVDEVDEDKDDPEVAARRAAELAAELQREAEEFGLTDSNAAEVYGPNGEAVASLLDSLSEVDYETAEAIADAYEAIPEAERKVARSVVRRRHRGGGLDADLWAAEHAVSDWLAAMQLEGDEAALYGVVADAATDAVDALVLEDDLADVDFATLYGPWSDVMDTDDDDGAGDDAGDDEAEPANGSGSAETTSAEEGAEADGEFGPNTELVLQFLTKLAALTAAETSELVTAWRRQPKEELRIAHRDLQALADEDRRWREQLRLAQEEVFAWMSGRSEKRDYSFGAPQSLARVREPAGPAVADAVAAIAMADMLEPKDTETLYAPWAEVVKEPALPQYEEDEGDEAK